MPTEEFIIALFCRVDEAMGDEPQHPQAKLHPSEVVTLALLYALKGGGGRGFYRWLTRDYAALFPALPERTRLFRLFTTHRAWADRFLAAPTLLGIADSYGIELRHPRRHGRTPAQLGRKGLSNHRWIAGGKLCVLVNQWGRIVAWDDAAANVHDGTFHPLIARVADRSVVLVDGNFHRTTGDLANMQVCARGRWPQRILVETVFSLLTRVCRLKHAAHRLWAAFQMHLAFGSRCSTSSSRGTALWRMRKAQPTSPSPGSACDTSTSGYIPGRPCSPIARATYPHVYHSPLSCEQTRRCYVACPVRDSGGQSTWALSSAG